MDAEHLSNEAIAGRVESLYYALGALVGQLHESGLVEAERLINEYRLLSDRIDPAHPIQGHARLGLLQIARSFERELPGWAERRDVKRLFRAD